LWPHLPDHLLDEVIDVVVEAAQMA
jgi:hypothetical protein